ncbi:MAG TPA: uracil-DNA glycosylase [Calditrichia bacterium]|nr:uracil-DNA glycosylase [Calditrichia bacterium]
MAPDPTSSLDHINDEVTRCRLCPRLVQWREQVAAEKTKRFSGENYWGKGVPGFGDPRARLLIVGLAPAAHGANRTGRMFTGDRSGDWLYRALHKAGFANQPTSTSVQDGLTLKNAYITALCRCAPPANKPTGEEFANCRPFLNRETATFRDFWQSVHGPAAILCLGQLSYRFTLQELQELGFEVPKPRPPFGHGQAFSLSPQLRLFCSFHPSQQNTFTGRLTEEMLDGLFESIDAWLNPNE